MDEIAYLPVQSEETAKKVYENVSDLLNVACPNVPLSFIDRAHHIRSEYKSYKNKSQFCGVMVRFMSYRHQILFYPTWKSLEDVRIKLHLIKHRYGILKDAIHLIKEHSNLDHVYADIN